MRTPAGSRRWAPVVAGLMVAVLAGVALTVTHREPRPVVPPRVAIRVALADRATARALAGAHWNRASASPLDGNLERVDFWRASRVQLEVAINARRQIVQEQDFSRERVPYGDWLAYEPALMLGLSAIFLLATVVVPWRRMRNLDALAAVSLLVSVVLFQHRYLNPSLLAAGPGLLYLLARCAWWGMGPAREPSPSRPLLSALSPRAGAAARIRWLRIALCVVALMFAMVVLSSPFAVDVAYAVMEGATVLIHGMLPYGHMPPGIMHGDTYPILSYALYTPLALLDPVRSQWNSVEGALAIATLAALAAAGAAWRWVAGSRTAGRSSEAEEAGLRAALAMLTFPAVLITASTGTTDVVLAAMIIVALLLWRAPTAAAGILAAAGWFKLAPFTLLPVLAAPLRGRRLAAALGAVAIVSLAVLALVVSLGGLHGPAEMARAVSYQLSRGSLQSIWSALGIDAAQPIAEAGVLGLIAAATVRLWREPQLAGDPRRMAAICAAILLGAQLAANYWAFLYVIWVVPLLSVSLFEPGLGMRPQLLRVASEPASPVPALAA